MWKYIVYRILFIIPILLILSCAIFCLLRLNGTDPVAQYLLNSNLPSTPEVVTQLRHEFGLDKPLLEQYVLWVQKALTLDFGNSYMSGRAVADDFLYYLPNTLILVATGFCFIVVFSIPLGILSAHYKERLPDFLIRFLCFIGVCMPNFWLAFLLILFFSIKLDWLPPLGLEGAQSFVLPALSIAFMSLCVNTRLIRSNMLEICKERHIVYAYLRGLSTRTIALKHIFYNAFLPLLTAFGMHIGELIGGALMIESIFALPGIGAYSIQGIQNQDYPIIQCFVVVLCLIFTICNLLVDVFYAFLDPKIRRNEETKV